MVQKVDFESSTITFEDVVKELLDKLEYFPDSAAPSSRTTALLLSFIILDGAWMVTSVALLMGTCFGVKQTLSLLYYGPWLIVTVCMCLFDATAAILFGLDMSQTTNFANWMKFVGIEDSSEFQDFDSIDSSTVLTLAPSLAISSVSARFILIWLANWAGFFLVLRATVSVYREKEKIHRPTLYRSSPVRSRMDLDTSAARIRNWQLFYGAIETQSSPSNSSSETDFNSNSKEGKGVVHVGFRNERVPTISEDVSTFYHAYPDVAEDIDGASGVCSDRGGSVNSGLDELRGQLPWSYIPSPEDAARRSFHSSHERIELGNKNRKLYRLKSESSVSGTEM